MQKVLFSQINLQHTHSCFIQGMFQSRLDFIKLNCLQSVSRLAYSYSFERLILRGIPAGSLASTS